MSHHQSSFSIYRAASKASEAAVVAAMLKATSEACYFMPEKLLKLHLLGRSAVRAVRSEEQVNRVLSHVPTSAREPLVLPTRGLHVSNTDSTQLAPLSLLLEDATQAYFREAKQIHHASSRKVEANPVPPRVLLGHVERSVTFHVLQKLLAALPDEIAFDEAVYTPFIANKYSSADQ